MRKLFIIFMFAFCTSTWAENLNDSVEFINYEQSWLDSRGTLTLKNNSSIPVERITFIITYLEMDGTPSDYKEFTKRVSIMPGMTKKVDIEAYEHSRGYSYYKSEADYSNPHRFKVKFSVNSINGQVNGRQQETIDDKSPIDELLSDSYDRECSDRMNDVASAGAGYYMIFVLFLVLVFIGIAVGLYVLVAVMAQKRHRSVIGWLLLSFIATPLLICIILLFIGDGSTSNDNSHYNKLS